MARRMGKKFSSEYLAVANPFSMSILAMCIVIGWAIQSPATEISSTMNEIYTFCSAYFPFSTIEHQASISSHPSVIRAQMLVLWIFSPLFFFVVAKFSSEKLIRLRIGPLGRKWAYYLLYMIAIFLSLINIIFYIPSTHICGRCETDTVVLSAIFKWIYFWLIGYSLGKIFALYNYKGE